MNDFLDQDIHTVITVCGNADQGVQLIWSISPSSLGFEDPAPPREEDEVMEAFRKVRNEIKLVFEAYAAGIKAAN